MELLKIDGTIVAVIINFLVLVYLLNRFLFKPVLKTLDERRAKIGETLDQADTRLKEASTLQKEYEEKLREARRESQQILEETREEAEKLRNELKRKTEKEITQMKARTEEEIKDLKEKAFQELKGEVGHLAILAASKIVEKSIDEKTHQAFLSQFVGQLGKEKN